jgi:hypothetical protein
LFRRFGTLGIEPKTNVVLTTLPGAPNCEKSNHKVPQGRRIRSPGSPHCQLLTGTGIKFIPGCQLLTVTHRYFLTWEAFWGARRCNLDRFRDPTGRFGDLLGSENGFKDNNNNNKYLCHYTVREAMLHHIRFQHEGFERLFFCDS